MCYFAKYFFECLFDVLKTVFSTHIIENLLVLFPFVYRFKETKRNASARKWISMLKPEDFFSLLSDETRLRCLLLLQMKGECCVCDLTYALKKAQPKVSRHLAILKGAGAVVGRREGAWIYYYLHPKLPVWALRLLAAAAKETSELYRLDFINLGKRTRTASCCQKASKPDEVDESEGAFDIKQTLFKPALT